MRSLQTYETYSSLGDWIGVVATALYHINKVTLRRARLVSGLVTFGGCSRLRRRTVGTTRLFSVAGPTVSNSLPDSLRDPAVESEHFRQDLETHLCRTLDT